MKNNTVFFLVFFCMFFYEVHEKEGSTQEYLCTRHCKMTHSLAHMWHDAFIYGRIYFLNKTQTQGGSTRKKEKNDPCTMQHDLLTHVAEHIYRRQNGHDTYTPSLRGSHTRRYGPAMRQIHTHTHARTHMHTLTHMYTFVLVDTNVHASAAFSTHTHAHTRIHTIKT